MKNFSFDVKHKSTINVSSLYDSIVRGKTMDDIIITMYDNDSFLIKYPKINHLISHIYVKINCKYIPAENLYRTKENVVPFNSAHLWTKVSSLDG